MKIYKRKDFLALPAGTVFFDYEPHISGSLSVKTSGDDTPSAEDAARGLTGDFCRQDIDATELDSTSSTENMDALEDMVMNGTERQLVFDGSGRDGAFDPDALFAVLDDGDVQRLIETLTTAWKKT